MSVFYNQQIVSHYRQTTSFYRLFWSWGVYAFHAGFYDKNNIFPWKALENTNRVLAKIVGITPEDKILDAGCGIGGSAVWIAKNIGAKVTGINLSLLQLKIARKLARKKGMERLTRFLVKDYCATGFRKESFDVVWALESVCHAENKEAFVKEAFRVLKPGGRLLISDGFLNKKRDRLVPFLRSALGVFESGYNIGPLVSVREFRSFIKRAGYRRAEFIDKTDLTRLNWWLGFFICLLALPVVTLLNTVKLIRRPALRDLCITGILQPFGELLGVGRYGVFLAVK